MHQINNYGIFHDGSFDGLLLDDKSAHIFVATDAHERHVIVADGVVVLKADDIRQGNIILDVVARHASELSANDLDAFLYDPQDPKEKEQAAVLLRRAQTGALTLLQISPSYGATCSVLAKTFELLDHREWLERHAMRG